MATTSLQSLHHRLLHQKHHHCHRSSTASFPIPDSSLFLKPAPGSRQKLFSSLSSSSSPSSSLTTPSPVAPSTSSAADADSPSLELLAQYLSDGDFRQADEVTRRLLIVLAGEASQKRGYIFFSEVQFIPTEELQAVDRLWLEHSGGRFGYSAQRRAWEKVRRDFTRFFIRVGWMKKLDTEVEQYNYRSFPEEFIWQLEGTPEGHLPLTNALRGTQLLCSILTHPAFENAGEAAEVPSTAGEDRASDDLNSRERPMPMGTRKLFKSDYSF
ncbi:hypothetical protein Taro_015510 [Colocasia esculenta]|uniref:GUN4-like domain-containing protein n=1 Tax=Colocasia esculenta TaxID=4460 RepID=A0A843ULF8_COLES|nr:hypothetical protein [Colocasia esculenta]